jgi:16S rRNA (adenine1518-N6/adenine1519-N6)-dimethyltransferase
VTSGDRPSSTSASEASRAAGDLPPLREVIRRHGLGADKRLGQHFLLDPSILARIAQAAGDLRGRVILEVGPGPGGLTRARLDAGAERLVVVEKDPRCLVALEEIASRHPGRLEVVGGDARRFDLAPLAARRKLKIVANLPYNVGTELLVRWLERANFVESMTLMFQKEVALRVTAAPATADWGRLAVLAQSVCAVRRLFDLPPAAFVPPPKVHSSLVQLVPREDRPSAELVARLSRVTAAAFGQRRKMLRSSLKSLGVPSEALLEAASIDPTRRAETLSLEEFARVADALAAFTRQPRTERGTG